jgi:hypothetical protein
MSVRSFCGGTRCPPAGSPWQFFEEPGLSSNEVQEKYMTQMMDSNVILAIFPEHMDQIVTKEKNHKFIACLKTPLVFSSM